MHVIATSTITAIDLINLSKDVAQLNLGYLGISVAVLGVFIYFNIRSLKDNLDKQEKAIGDLKEEALDLLEKSRKQNDETLNKFKEEQVKSLVTALEQQKANTDLDFKNKIQAVESTLSDKIDLVSDNKDIKLKEIILSEVVNRLAQLEKTLTTAITSSKSDSDKKLSQVEDGLSGLKSDIKDSKRDIKELKVYKFSKENKMGAIIYSIDLLREDIDGKRSYPIVKSLERLKSEIDGKVIEPEYVSEIEEQFARIKDDPKYSLIISQIRSIYTDKKPVKEEGQA